MTSLDAEEQAILESVENGEWHSVANLVQEIQQYQQYAQSHRSDMETVNVQLPISDLQSLQALAQESDTSVSLLIASVIHQFIATHQK